MGLSLPIRFRLVCCHEAGPKSLPQKQPNYKIKWAQNKIEHKREFFLLASGFLAPAGLLAYWLCFVCSLGGPSVFFFFKFFLISDFITISSQQMRKLQYLNQEF